MVRSERGAATDAADLEATLEHVVDADAKEAAAAAMSEVAGGMNIPGLGDALSKFGPGGS